MPVERSSSLLRPLRAHLHRHACQVPIFIVAPVARPSSSSRRSIFIVAPVARPFVAPVERPSSLLHPSRAHPHRRTGRVPIFITAPVARPPSLLRLRLHALCLLCLDGRTEAFEGEVLDGHGLPRLWRFAEEEEKLLQLWPLAANVLEYAAMFYRDGDRDDEFHNRQTPPLGGRLPTVQTCLCLIPIPVGWAPMFLDYPPMGVVYRRLIQLMVLTADAAGRHHFRAFGEGVALACGSLSAADSSCKRVAYGKATLSAATAAWEGHRPGASKPPPPRTEPRAPTNFDNLFGGPVR